MRLYAIADRFLGLFRRSPDPGFEDEIRQHVALLTDRYTRQGMPPEEADRAARRQFGNVTALQEVRTEMQTLAALERLARDLRYGARILARNPGFAAVAFLTLAIGIGANTAIFSLVEALLLKPLPYQDPTRIVVPATIFQRQNSDTGSVSYADILDWKAQRDLFEAVAAYAPLNVDVTGAAEPERVHAIAADEEYFRVMGAPLLLGRAPTAAEQKPGNARVAVLTYGFWMRRFGGDPKVEGAIVELNGIPFRVVGVARKDATWPADAEVFRPFVVNLDADILRRDNLIFQSVARLRSGVSIKQAQARLTAMGARIAQQNITRAGTNWKLHPLRDYILGPTLRRTLVILLGASLLVLLIACVNVANLLLVRGAGRSREVAVRNALGAGWKRLAAQFFAETASLAIAGAFGGVGIGYAALRLLIRFAPADVPRLDQAHIDLGALAFAALLCLLAAVVAGVGPAIHTARRSPASGFQEASRGSSTGVRSARLRGFLVVSELGLALVLLAGAGLLIRSFQLVQRVDPGFPTHNLLTLRIGLPASRYPGAAKSAAGFESLAAAIRRIPGVTAVSSAGSLPVDGGGFYLGRAFLREGQPEPPATSDSHGLWDTVQPGFFETMGIRILAGRSFNERDTAESMPVIIISQSLAREMFPGQNPLGRRIRSWRDENKYREIVGVVGDVHFGVLTESAGESVYVPYRQDTWGLQMFCIRTAADPAPLVPSIRREIWSIDKKLSVSEVKTMDEILATGMARHRFTMSLLGVFGAVALLLAAMGIYGVVAYSVAQRSREIGIRMALGAARADVLRLVARGALGLAAAGVVCGVAGALAVTRLMKTLLFGVSPSDPRTFVLVAALLMLVTMAAALIPARRAAKVDPVVALRYE